MAKEIIGEGLSVLFLAKEDTYTETILESVKQYLQKIRIRGVVIKQDVFVSSGIYKGKVPPPHIVVWLLDRDLIGGNYEEELVRQYTEIKEMIAPDADFIIVVDTVYVKGVTQKAKKEFRTWSKNFAKGNGMQLISMDRKLDAFRVQKSFRRDGEYYSSIRHQNGSNHYTDTGSEVLLYRLYKKLYKILKAKYKVR